jgi:parallel beta-helix repeat protein
LQYSSYNTLAHNLCNDNDYRGIRLMLSSHHNTLVNNTCNYSGQSGLEVSESTFNMIANSSCNGNYADGLSLGANNNTLANNTCLQNGMSGIGLWRAYGNLIANNTCSDNEHGIELDDSDFNTLDYNRCRDNYWYNINLFGACDNVVTRNTLTGSQWGCYVTRWSANKIANNAFLGCGIYLDLFWAATYCTIPSFPKTLFVNNTVNGKALVVWQDKAEASLIEDAGQVILINCSHVTVQDQVLNNTTIGIHLIKCREITVTNNTCRHNTIWGLYLTDANATLATHNTFGPNELSVHLEAAWYIHTEEPPVFLRGNWNNSFLWNSFVDNSWHGALDHGAETVFDRNYWSDYTGKDLNDDGYGDTPYEVPNGNADAHPLMLPPGLVIWRQLPVGQVVFLNSPFRYDLNASAAPPGLATWWLNDTRLFAINHAGVVTNSTTLDLGVYPLRVSVNDTYGNTLTAAFTVTVVPRTQPRQPTDILPTVVLVVVAAAFLAAVSYGIVSDWRHQRRLRGPA